MRRKGFVWKLLTVALMGAFLIGCGKTEGADAGRETGEAAVSEASLNPVAASLSDLLGSEQSASEEKQEDWSGRYENYFDEHPVMNTVMDVYTETQGNKIFLRFAFGQTEEMLYVKYAVWECSAKKELDTSTEDNYVVLYFTKDGEAYLETVMKGKKTEYQRTSGLDWSLVGQVSQTDRPMGIVNTMLEDIKYDREEVIDCVVYDVLVAKSLRQTQSKANRYVKNFFFINRETQELEKYQLKDSIETLDCTFTPLDMDSIADIPEEMKKGKVVKLDEFAEKYALAIVKITYNSMGLDPDKYLPE